jgi:hypothetical protein
MVGRNTGWHIKILIRLEKLNQSPNITKKRVTQQWTQYNNAITPEATPAKYIQAQYETVEGSATESSNNKNERISTNYIKAKHEASEGKRCDVFQEYIYSY